MHGWLDRRITERGNTFHQVTTGIEWLGESVDVRLNGYIPLSGKREFIIPNADPQAPELSGTGILVDTHGKLLEEPQGGFDLELGLELGQYSDFVRDNTDRFHVYAGGYYLDGPNTEDVAGWRTRFTADVTENIQFGAKFQRDDVRGSQGFLEATFRFPFGVKKSYRQEGIRARLDESPERDIDIVTNETIDTGNRVQVLNATTGAVQEVLNVDNSAPAGGDGTAENPFNTLSDAQTAASAHTIIYVNRGTGDDTNQDQGITLSQTGQQLIGSGTNFVYDAERFITANGASPLSILIASATTAPVIGNVNGGQDGVTITADNVTVAGVTVDNDNTGRDGIVVEADGAAASAQNVTIQNVTTQNNRHGIYIHGTNDGSVSAMVQNTITTSNSQHGIAVYDDTNGTFTADLGGGEMGSAGNNVLAGNRLEDLAVDYDGRTLAAQNNWWGQASGPDTDTPDIGIAPQIYYGAPINDGLVGHWTFDSEWTTDTTAYDRSGQGNNGTLQGGLSLADQVSGQHRQALDFDGIDDFVTVPDDDSLDVSTDLTILMDMYVDRLDNPDGRGFPTLIAKSNTNYRFFIREENSRIYTRFTGSGKADLASNSQVNIAEWQNTGIVYDNSSGFSLYLDGNLDNFDGQAGGGLTPNNDSLTIGDWNTGGRFFDGKIDDTRIYNRALDPTEISELNRMDTSSSVNTSGFLSSAP